MTSYAEQVRRFSHNARLFVLFIFLNFLGDGLFLLLYNLYLVQLGFREDFIGLFAGLTALGAGLWAIPAGVLTDRLGRKGALLTSALLLAVAHLGQALLTDPLVLLALSFLGGMAMALYWVPRGPFLTANSTLAERTHLFTVALVGEEIMGMVAGLVGGQLPAAFARILPGVVPDSPVAFRYTLLIGVTLTVVGMVPLRRIGEDLEAEQEVAERPGGMGRPVWEIRPAWHIMAVLALLEISSGIGSWMVIPFVNVYFVKELGVSTAQVGYLFFANAVVTTGSVLVAPLAAQRLGQVGAITLARLGSVPLTGLMAIVHQPLLAAVTYLGRNASFFVGIPISGALSMEVVPSPLQATTSSVRHTMRSLSRTAGSFLAGQLIIGRGYPSVFLASSGLMLLSAVILYGYFHGVEQGMVK